MTTGISFKWSALSQSFLGNPDGIHCHWCKHAEIDADDGEVTCANKDGLHFGDGRIRTWDGEDAARCKAFELSETYKSDDAYDNIGKDVR